MLARASSDRLTSSRPQKGWCRMETILLMGALNF